MCVVHTVYTIRLYPQADEKEVKKIIQTTTTTHTFRRCLFFVNYLLLFFASHLMLCIFIWFFAVSMFFCLLFVCNLLLLLFRAWHTDFYKIPRKLGDRLRIERLFVGFTGWIELNAQPIDHGLAITHSHVSFNLTVSLSRSPIQKPKPKPKLKTHRTQVFGQKQKRKSTNAVWMKTRTHKIVLSSEIETECERERTNKCWFRAAVADVVDRTGILLFLFLLCLYSLLLPSVLASLVASLLHFQNVCV